MADKRVVIIGLDGMPYGLMSQFAKDGTMPNFGELARSSAFTPMASSIPEISSVAWSSIITGVNPGEHGIFGFIDVAPGTYRRTFPNYNSLHATPFWNRQRARRSVIINVPTTYPAAEMNGVLIAGFVALDLKRAVYPQDLVPQLNEIGYKVDVESSKAHVSFDYFLRDLDKTLDARIEAYRYLWHEQVWDDTFMLVFTGTDRLAHFLWDAYMDEGHKYHDAFLDHFRKIDEVVGEIVQSMRDGDILVMLSDHGFETLEKNVNVNYLLQEAGFLRFEDGEAPSLNTIDASTKAFALEPGRIYVNLENKYPRGSVKASDQDAVLKDIMATFEALKDQDEMVIKHIYDREELYHGPYADRAPDLVLLGEPGYNLRGSWKAKDRFTDDVFSGKHSQSDAFLLVRGEGETDFVSGSPTVFDIVNILDAMRRS
jgi:predicted AlkP superfamily phosphohydrolase/phosphomutase